MSEKEKVVLWRTEDEPGHPEWWTSRPVDDPEAEFRGDEPVEYIAVPAASDPVPALEADLVALRAERDEVAKAERERIARKFDDKATTCRAMLKVETNIGRLAEYARAVPRTTARIIEDLPHPASDACVRSWMRNLGVYRTPSQAINAEQSYAARRKREAEAEVQTMTVRLARLRALR